MLSKLDDDCLYLICMHLGVEDHISLSQISERLRQVIADYYRTHKKVILDENIWDKLPWQKQEFVAAFATNIGPHIRELSIAYMEDEEWNLLNYLSSTVLNLTTLELKDLHMDFSIRVVLDKYLCSLSAQLKKLTLHGSHFFESIDDHQFPNVTNLDVRDDHDYLSITKEMFPALTNLKIHGPYVDVLSLCEVKSLTTLEINYNRLTQQELTLIFDALPLKKIEIGTITQTDLWINGISKCQTLEELVFAHFGGPLHELTELKNLQKISVDGEILPIFKHPNAVCRYLSILNAELSEFKLGAKLKNLQHLKIYSPPKDLNAMSYYITVLQILTKCHDLRVFEIHNPESNTILILEKLAHIIGRIYGDRKEALSILCGVEKQHGLQEPQRFKNLSFPSFVTLSLIDYYDSPNDFDHLQCDWHVTKD